MGSQWLMRSRNPHEIHGHEIRERILYKKTPYQVVEIIETYNYGRVLLLDGIPQSSQFDEFIYHEALVHPALCAHPDPRRVLVVGGGEGAVLREILKYSSIAEVIMVDIDSELVDICKTYLVKWHAGTFNDPKVRIIYMDGFKYLLETAEHFDIIILDLSDAFEGGPASKLNTTEFYSLVQKVLDEHGILSIQADRGALGDNLEHTRIIKNLSTVFPYCLPYYTHMPIFSTLYGFAVCSNYQLKVDFLHPGSVDKILSSKDIDDLLFFDGRTACSMFAIPRYLRDIVPHHTWDE